jgi:hypothetical protein
VSIFLWIIAIPLALLWVFIVLANGFITVRCIRGIFEAPSPIPLVGSIVGVAAIALIPIGSFHDRLPFVGLGVIADLVLPIEGVCQFLYYRRRKHKP